MVLSSRKTIDHPTAVDGPEDKEGGRSPSRLSTGQSPHARASAPTFVPTAKVGPLAPGQRWSVARYRKVVLRLLRGESVDLPLQGA